MKLELYYAPVACSLVPFVTLTEAGAEFTVHTISLRNQEQKSPEYLRINPKHKVPLLVVDDKPLSENIAIQLWIARNFPQARLMPTDPWEEFQALSLLSWCASGFHPYLSIVNSPQKYCDLEGSETSIVRRAGAVLLEQFALAERRLAKREFFFDHFTTADAYFYWCFRRARLLGLNLSDFTACMKHFETMEMRPSVLRVLAYETESAHHRQAKY